MISRSIRIDKNAIQDLIDLLTENKTWFFSTLPSISWKLKDKWVETIKCESIDNILYFIAWWVVKSYFQHESIKPNNTMALVVGFMSYNVIFTLFTEQR